VGMSMDGYKVQALRRSKVMERRELAERSGISYSTLAQIETNRRTVRAATVRRIASVLGVEPEDLVRTLEPSGAGERRLRLVEPPASRP
jgi:transcriptional regulator with XRE-family HTH domain